MIRIEEFSLVLLWATHQNKPTQMRFRLIEITSLLLNLSHGPKHMQSLLPIAKLFRTTTQSFMVCKAAS